MLGGETRWTTAAEPGRMVASGTEEEEVAPAWTERTEPMGHSRQPRSWMSRFTASVESKAAEGPAAPGGGATALMLTVARRGRSRSSELSASTITGLLELYNFLKPCMKRI